MKVNVPIDYETEKHRGFAFVEFELPEDAQVKNNVYWLIDLLTCWLTDLVWLTDLPTYWLTDLLTY